jgi:hypothetical protein
MKTQSRSDEWTVRIVREPIRRERELRRAAVTETVFSLFAAVLAIVSVWAFTAEELTPFAGIRPTTIGGVAVLCFSACMAIAAGGGIRKRLISLVNELESRQG